MVLRVGIAVLMLVLAGQSLSAEPVAVVRASSIHPGKFEPAYALDGDMKTRWASTEFQGRPEWLEIDLGSVVPVESVTIHWETARPQRYELRVSEDGKKWTTICVRNDCKGGREALTGLASKGRYLRIVCLEPASWKLVSIWEVELGGSANKALAAGRKRADEARLAAQAESRRKLAQMLPTIGVEEIVFAARSSGVDGHWYANFGYYARDVKRKLYGKGGGRLYKLNLKTGQMAILVDDAQGAVRDPQMHYDGKKIIFSYRKGEGENYHLYEINADGTGLKQLTDGPWDDIEPAYLPDGGIVFVSSRCKRWVNCWLTQVAVNYRCDADGRNVRPLSANVEQDNTPWVLPDGRILYTRWEYIDRSQVDYHHLWTMSPDGTGQTVYFGNYFPGIVMIDAKPIAGTDKVLATFSPGHGAREHAGPFYVVDPKGGPDQRGLARDIRCNGRDPYPVGQDLVLYAKGNGIYLADYNGNSHEVYSDPRFELHEPRPVAGRVREVSIPPRSDPAKATGKLILADVHVGRNMDGVKRGEIKKLLVVESLPKPINYTGGMDPLTYGGSFTLERVLGTVPVEADGSAYMELPALRSFFFVALDANNLSVKRMQSFLTVMPGETTGCVGCHEQRTQTIQPSQNLLALRRKPSQVQPIAGVPDILDFPRDIQPILDRHCVKCHDYDKRGPDSLGPRAGGVILTGDRGPMFSHAYYTLTVRKQFADGRNHAQSSYGPRQLGSSASPIMKKITGEHHDVKLTTTEIDTIRYWIEAGAPYPGTYAALGTGMIGGYDTNNPVETDNKWPESVAAAGAMKQRCVSCHTGPKSLPKNLSDENGLSFWRPSWNDERLQRSRHNMFNLSRPEKSLALLAPLAKEAGGLGVCVKDGKAVFADAKDADYQKILAMCVAGKKRLEEITRFDMPNFKPEPAYLREMKRYGVLTSDVDPAKLNVYELDRRYWESLWWKGSEE